MRGRVCTPVARAVPPLDAVVYGDHNGYSLVDRTGSTAVAVPAPPSGQSLVRRSLTSWVSQAVPTPGICEVRW